MPGFHSIVSPCSHHAQTGKMVRLWLKLLDLAASPTTAEKEHDAGPPVGLFPSGRVMATVSDGLRLTYRGAIDEIRNLTVHGPDVFLPQMLALCVAAGVAVALVPEIKGAPVSGAAKWLTPSKAMICLNLRGKRNDRFWFTFFHEAGHILNDSKKETYIDVDYKDDPRERQANHFAATILIRATYDRELPGLTSYAAVQTFARRIGIAPGIVVGRLQREGIVDYRQFNGLKQQLQWIETH